MVDVIHSEPLIDELYRKPDVTDITLSLIDSLNNEDENESRKLSVRDASHSSVRSGIKKSQKRPAPIKASTSKSYNLRDEDS